MGIPLGIFSLYRLHGEGANCNHYLLLRVEQPAFSNADQRDYDNAVEVADRKRSVLIRAYQSKALANECAKPHVASLVGELQALPTGDELIEGHGGFNVDLWMAETRFGHPWIVMGTADDEETFWREVEKDEDLSRLGAVKPATKQRAFFLTEQDEICKA